MVTRPSDRGQVMSTPAVCAGRVDGATRYPRDWQKTRVRTAAEAVMLALCAGGRITGPELSAPTEQAP